MKSWAEKFTEESTDFIKNTSLWTHSNRVYSNDISINIIKSCSNCCVTIILWCDCKAHAIIWLFNNKFIIVSSPFNCCALRKCTCNFCMENNTIVTTDCCSWRSFYSKSKAAFFYCFYYNFITLNIFRNIICIVYCSYRYNSTEFFRNNRLVVRIILLNVGTMKTWAFGKVTFLE